MKQILKWSAMALCVFALTWLAFDYWTKAALERACDDWPLLNRPLAELSQVYPTSSGNPSARELKLLSTQLNPVNAEDSTLIGRDTQAAVRTFLQDELKKPVAAIDYPPDQLQRALQINKDILEKMATTLLREGELVLPLNVEIGPTDEIPSMQWCWNIGQLLVTNALWLQRTGQSDRAWLFLHAGSRLADALFSQPSMYSQMLACAMGRDILLAMRKMNSPAPAWALTWPTHDVLHAMSMAFTGTARTMLTMTERSALPEMAQTMNEMFRELGLPAVEVARGTRYLYAIIGRQLLRLFAADQILFIKDTIDKTLHEDLCSARPTLFSAKRQPAPSWLPGKDLLMTMYFMNSSESETYENFWVRLQRFLIHKTGTQAILTAKDMKISEGNGQWPLELPGIPGICEHYAWFYAVEEDGSAFFTFRQSMPKTKSMVPAPEEYLTYSGVVSD